MNLDEFPSLDFLLPYTGNTTLQMKLIFGALTGLVAGIMLILIASVLVFRFRRKKRKMSTYTVRIFLLFFTFLPFVLGVIFVHAVNKLIEIINNMR